jgi:hypothetical protein
VGLDGDYCIAMIEEKLGEDAGAGAEIGDNRRGGGKSALAIEKRDDLGRIAGPEAGIIVHTGREANFGIAREQHKKTLACGARQGRSGTTDVVGLGRGTRGIIMRCQERGIIN